MNKKNAARLAAVIEIGSSNVKMRVSQLSKGRVQTLDYLEYPVSLDHDVFETGSIRFESLRELSAALSKFSAALLSYNIEKPRVVSCTALLEAKNRALVVDQLKVRNGMEVAVLDSSLEKAYLFSEIEKRLGPALDNGSSLIVFIGAGSIGGGIRRKKSCLLPKYPHWHFKAAGYIGADAPQGRRIPLHSGGIHGRPAEPD